MSTGQVVVSASLLSEIALDKNITDMDVRMVMLLVPLAAAWSPSEMVIYGSRLSDALGVTRTTVARSLKRLTKAGYLVRDHKSPNLMHLKLSPKMLEGAMPTSELKQFVGSFCYRSSSGSKSDE